MDIRINLLPPELKWQLEQKRKQRKALALMGGVLLFLGLILCSLLIMNYHLQREIEVIQAEKRQLEQKFSLYQPYQEMQAQRQRVQGLITQARGTQPDYYAILEGLGLYIPGDIQVTSLEVGTLNKDKMQAMPQNEAMQKAADLAEKLEKSINPQEQKPQVISGEFTLQGYAVEAAAVASWLEELRKIPDLTDIRCQSIAEEYQSGQALTRFAIKAALVQPISNTEVKAGE